METKKPTNKQILDAYGQSYELMQEGKRHDDKVGYIQPDLKGFETWLEERVKYNKNHAINFRFSEASEILTKFKEITNIYNIK